MTQLVNQHGNKNADDAQHDQIHPFRIPEHHGAGQPENGMNSHRDAQQIEAHVKRRFAGRSNH